MDNESNSHPRAIAFKVESPQSQRIGVFAISGTRLRLNTRIDNVHSAETRTIEIGTCRAELSCQYEENRATMSFADLKLVESASTCVGLVLEPVPRFKSSSFASSSDSDLRRLCQALLFR